MAIQHDIPYSRRSDGRIMGRQSARLINRGMDHKDIFFNGYYHKQMWITDKDANPTLLWEKLVNKKVFSFTVRDTMTSTLGAIPPPGKIVMNIVTPYKATPMVIDWGDGTTETTNGSTYFFHEFPTSDNSLYTVNIHYESLASFAGSIFYSGNYVSAIEEILTPLPILESKIDESAVALGNIFASAKSLKRVCPGFFDNYLDFNILINAISMFSNSGLEEVPQEFSRGAKNIRIDYMFLDCYSLRYVDPTAFLKSELRRECSSVFMNCTSLKELPGVLFVSNNSMIFDNLCNGCNSLEYVPETFFDFCPNVFSVTKAFYGCYSITSKVPQLWEREWVGSRYYEECYRSCYNAENYDDIPSGWK